MRRNPELDAALDELAKHGVTDVARSGRKHIKLTFTHKGEDKLLVVSGTPSDKRGTRNVRATVRGILGVTASQPKSTRPRKAKPKAPKGKTEIPAITCGKDPWRTEEWAQYRSDYEEARCCIDQFGPDLGNKVAASCRRIRAASRAAVQRIQEIAR